MRFKRDEGFRFSFGTPLEAFFTIDILNGKMVDTSEGEAKLIDLSPNGMKLNTYLDIPVSDQSNVIVSVRFSLNETEYRIQGKIIWKEDTIDSFFYGIHFSMEEKEQEDMIGNLKYYAKNQQDI